MYSKLPKSKVVKACEGAIAFMDMQHKAKLDHWRQHVKFWNPWTDPEHWPSMPETGERDITKLRSMLNLAKKSTGDIYVGVDTWALIEGHYE